MKELPSESLDSTQHELVVCQSFNSVEQQMFERFQLELHFTTYVLFWEHNKKSPTCRPTRGWRLASTGSRFPSPRIRRIPRAGRTKRPGRPKISTRKKKNDGPPITLAHLWATNRLMISVRRSHFLALLQIVSFTIPWMSHNFQGSSKVEWFRYSTCSTLPIFKEQHLPCSFSLEKTIKNRSQPLWVSPTGLAQSDAPLDRIKGRTSAP